MNRRARRSRRKPCGRGFDSRRLQQSTFCVSTAFVPLPLPRGMERPRGVILDKPGSVSSCVLAGAPQRDWIASRLGPNPPESLVRLASDTFARLTAACGASVSLFTDADGTAQREAWRRWHLSSVLPVAGLIEAELSARFEVGIRFGFDMYATDIAGRAMAFQKLVAGGMSVEKAASVSGVLMSDDG